MPSTSKKSLCFGIMLLCRRKALSTLIRYITIKIVFDQKTKYKGNFRKSALHSQGGMDEKQPTMLIKLAPN